MNSDAMMQAVQRLYAEFARYQAPKHMLDVCTGCCMDAELEQEMRRLPLRQITAGHFYQYNSSAKSIEQPEAETKYLLPRLLELLSQGAELHHSVELYLDRLGRCAAALFSKSERAAIDAFALVFFAEGLRQSPLRDHAQERFMGHDVFDMLLMFDVGGIAIAPLLTHWLHDDSAAATVHYVTASYWNFWRGQEIENAFATDRPAFRATMKSWMLHADHRARFVQKMLATDLNALAQQAGANHGQSCELRSGMQLIDVWEATFDLVNA